MSLATRCSACGTAFRVVQDQLKISEGWVRCGHCGEVFDALEGLFDLERADTSGRDQGGTAFSTDTPPADTAPVSTGSAEPKPAGNALAAEESPDHAASESAIFIDPGRPAPSDALEAGFSDAAPVQAQAGSTAVSSDDPIDAHLFGDRRGERRRAPSVQAWDRDRPDFSDARYDSDLAADASDPDGELHDSAALTPDPPLESAAAHPEFLRRAEHRARWERPGVRRALLGLAVLATLGLAMQGLHHFRDDVAARWPTAAPALHAWCGVAGCTIGPPRHINQVSVESTALARAPAGNVFRLAVALRNRASMPLAVPWLDLTLTDAGGRLIARKALGPRDLTPATASLTPSAEIVLQAVLEMGDPRVSGYTVEIFYP